MIIWSGGNFAHVTTAELLWHVQICHLTGWLKSKKIFLRYQLWAPKHLVKWGPDTIVDIENNVCTRVMNGFTVHETQRGSFWCLFPTLRSIKGNKHQNNTRVSTVTVHHKSKYIILFLTRRNGSMNDNKNDLYTSCLTCSVSVLLMMSQSIADDVTMTRQSWHDHVNSDI